MESVEESCATCKYRKDSWCMESVEESCATCIYRKDSWCMESVEESCANDGEHNENNEQGQECK